MLMHAVGGGGHHISCFRSSVGGKYPEIRRTFADVRRSWCEYRFVVPVSQEKAEAFWVKKVLPEVRAGERVLLAAFVGSRIAGTVQLVLSMPANQPHRAEVSKLLVHPEYRRRGLARRMMLELEGRAGKFRKTLLTLDTRTGDAAEPLYASLGFQTTGIIPGYCLDPDATGRLDATTIMYKQLQSHTSASDR
jgi:ribosomal protein S18 acetylase RimI-like enzyme